MTINRGLWVPINTGNVGTTEVEARLADGALYESNDGINARSGVLDPQSAVLVTGAANMSYNLAACAPVINRSSNEGVYRFTATGTTNVATTAAPAANSRIDVIYVKQRDQNKGDSDNTAVVGVIQGAVAASPVAPALTGLATGGIEIARAVVGPNITATTSASITQTFRYAALKGNPIPVRNATERAEITAPRLGQRVRRLDLTQVQAGGVLERWNGTNWDHFGHAEWTTASNGLASGTAYNLGTFTATAGKTTDSAFVTVVASGGIQARDAGLYRIDLAQKFSGSVGTARAFLSIEDTAGVTATVPFGRAPFGNGEDSGSLSVEVALTAGQTVYPKVFQAAGTLNVSGVVRVSRVVA